MLTNAMMQDLDAAEADTNAAQDAVQGDALPAPTREGLEGHDLATLIPPGTEVTSYEMLPGTNSSLAMYTMATLKNVDGKPITFNAEPLNHALINMLQTAKSVFVNMREEEQV